MPQLKEILHALVSDIAEAKSLANHTTVRRAELYKSHPLLSSLPTPRMRLSNVKIDLPMIIEGMIPGTKGTVADPETVVQRLSDVLRERSESRGIALSNGDLANFKRAFLLHLDRPASAADRLHNAGVREAFSRAVDLALIDVGKESSNSALFDQLGPIRHELKHAAASAALLNHSEPSLTVEVRTDEVKARTDPQSITRIHFELNEDGLEWERETEAPKRKLVPE